MASELENGSNANGTNANGLNVNGTNVNERSTSQIRVNSHPSHSSVDAKKMSRELIDTYFRTVLYPYTKHHIDSYDTFLQQDLKGIIKANNPILILKDLIDETNSIYKYKVELYIGGEDGEEIQIGTPTLHHQPYEEIRVLYPNEARLRNLTYASTVYANILVKITYTDVKGAKPEDLSPGPTTFNDWPLFTMPIMLHSSYCILHNKPKDFLKQAGECPYDNGGYFIVNGAEKVLITRQEKAFNTLYISPQNDPKTTIFASIQCISSESRQIKRVAFEMTRYNLNKMKKVITHETIKVSLPFVRKPIPLFILFRAIGFQSDEEICRLIFPDFDNPEAKLLMDKLQPSIIEAYPFLTTFTAIQYIKTLTKGFSAEHVVDIIRNQLFIHMPNDPMSQAIFLGDCVRKILRVSEGYDAKTDRDEMRNMRCLTSGFLIQELFNNSYKVWAKAIRLAIDKEYNYNKQTLYIDRNFANIFTKANESKIFLPGLLHDMIMKGFKGKWGTGLGEEKSGVLQSLSRLSYTDFMSHCRRVILDFDTGSAITGPRKLHTTQYGYFCTSETPTGGSIGIAKNLSIMTAISTSTTSAEFITWLHKKGDVYPPEEVTLEERIAFVPVYVNGGIMGYSEKPYELTAVLKMFKRTGCLPYSVSVVFSIRDRAVYIYMDAGRPLRPLIWLPTGSQDIQESFKKQYDKITTFKTWRFLVLGKLKLAAGSNLDVTMESTVFIDPYPDNDTITLKQYFQALEPHTGAIEYIDPYEQNETYIANFPYELKGETTHIEVHPSTIMSMMTSMIPFAQHNQSPRNQLSCSQSKQGVSIYATNWQNRFDNSAHILCYGEMPLVRTMYNNYLGEGNMVYGMNCILAIGCWTGYNQEDGIVMNYDAVHRGMFRTINYRSYEIFEEDDPKINTRVRIANPIHVAGWKDLRPGLDYSKLDNNGIIREGEIVDETTVLVGAYVQSAQSNSLKDASLCPQVWTHGRVEKIAIMVNNAGLHLVKIRIVQDRIPELGDKFCLTDDHEVLTDNGWKSIALVTKTDKVCSLTDNDQIEYVHPQELYKFNCINEELYHIKSQQVDLLTTLNHKMYVKKRNAEQYTLEEAKTLMGKRVQYKKDGINTNIDYQFELDIINHHSAKNVVLDMDLFLEFLGYWISDGWVYEIKHQDKESEYRIEVCLCKENDRVRFTELSNGLGYKTYSNSDNTKLYITNKQLASYLNEYSNGAINKQLPDWVWKLSVRQTKILIKGLIAGDGTVMKNGVERFFTSSIILSDQFQRLCLHAGWSANKVRVYEAGTKFIIKGKSTQANADYWSLTINKHKNNPMVNHSHVHQQKIQSEELLRFTGNVYCIQVPSHVFYVRRNGKPVWTGNSNRHGQKGTIGALLRGHDMPRTQSGIVPDMIMNPHAIPSRMTIAQNLEQLLGKSGLQAGAFGDGTSFMNSESPQDEIGHILEGNGFEKYGNEVMYNGATGEQITMAIFIGPVYGMRLKHMVEDKWQARGQGRKEVRTHQPTGGRGAQGGLKIGEMDRDAIIGHATASFFKEAFMERSDGVKMPICVSCGTVPIFNPRLGLAVCAMCDGPLQYIGDTASNLNLLPPLGRPKSKIVQVEMPYATKLLAQEQETFLNLSMRFITTNGVERLRPLERIEEENDAPQKKLEPLLVPLPDYVKPIKRAPDSLSADEILSLRTSISNEENEQETNFNDENEESEYSYASNSSVSNGSETSPVINITLSAPQSVAPQQNEMPLQQNAMIPQQNMMQPQQSIAMPQQPQINVNGVPMLQPIPQQPISQQPILQQQGGIPIEPNAPPQMGGSQVFPSITGAPIIAIDTSMQAMQQDGIDVIGGGRTIRRRQGGYNPGFSQVPMQASNQGVGQAAVGGFTITKLE
jgi:DNA-directed RNA polymerase II subunit RPB2